MHGGAESLIFAMIWTTLGNSSAFQIDMHKSKKKDPVKKARVFNFEKHSTIEGKSNTKKYKII